MRQIKTMAIAVMVTALMALLGTGTASGTTLEVGGVTKNESVSFTTSLKSGTSLILRDTFGFSAHTCNESHLAGATESPFSATKVTGKLSSLTFSNCSNSVTVHEPGQLYVEWTSGTNGRVYSESAEWTVFSSIHDTYINCKTGTGTLLGTLTGVKEGHATLDINATLNCEPHLSSARLTGTYTVTSPTGLGVSDSAPPPSGTTLEVGGVTKNESVSFTTSLKSGTSLILRDTFGFSAHTCNESHLAGATESPFSATKVTGKLSSLTFSNCSNSVTVHEPGALAVEWTSGTNGRVYSENAEWTVFSSLHETYINCKTSEAGVLIGTLTGVKEGHATLDINATLNCEPHLSSAKLTGTYTVTSPTGLGVSA